MMMGGTIPRYCLAFIVRGRSGIHALYSPLHPAWPSRKGLSLRARIAPLSSASLEERASGPRGALRPEPYYVHGLRLRQKINFALPSPAPINRSFFFQLKTNSLLLPLPWSHELANCRDERSNRLIVGFDFVFKLCQFMGQCLMGR